MSGFRSLIMLFVLVIAGAGCANIGSLPGGKKDTQPPKLVSVSPGDSVLNTRVNKLELRFNEFITVTDAAKEVQISPILSFPLNVVGAYKKVTVRIEDSLLQANTTYRISFGNAIKDLHEGNVFTGYTYTFSTGSYFDSLEINGEVTNAVTGMPDTGAFILLYSSSKSDSVVLREKPMYVGRVANGRFSVKGLPGRKFKIYALRDANTNLVYDGMSEWIAFNEADVQPGDTSLPKISMRLFPEVPDTTKFSADSIKSLGKARRGIQKEDKSPLTYTVDLDTSGRNKRTKDITRPIAITFNKTADTIANQYIGLYLDTTYVTVPITIKKDSSRENMLLIDAAWKENTVYTLKLQKGFAKDSAGNEPMPGKFIFRTKSDEDYGKLNVHLPAKYSSGGYVLLVRGEKDTVYQQTLADTMVHLVRLQPGNYSMLLIVDANGNGKWDTGDMLARRQPEMVIPYKDPMALKAGWENTIDFEETKKTPKGDAKGDSMQKRK